METDKERQRRGFVADYESGQWSMTELCERYGISRPTGYELWVDRYEQAGAGPQDSEDRSRAPGSLSAPHAGVRWSEQILALRASATAGARRSCCRSSKKTTPEADLSFRPGAR